MKRRREATISGITEIRLRVIHAPRRVVLDTDSTEIKVHSHQEQSAYNGHFAWICYHPLLLLSRRRLSGDEAASGQCAQRRRLGGFAVTRD